jgi:hypothetical protein
MLPTYSMIPKLFLFSFLICTQIWLSPLFGWLPTHLPHNFEKNKVTARDQNLVAKNFQGRHHIFLSSDRLGNPNPRSVRNNPPSLPPPHPKETKSSTFNFKVKHQEPIGFSHVHAVTISPKYEIPNWRDKKPQFERPKMFVLVAYVKKK